MINFVHYEGDIGEDIRNIETADWLMDKCFRSVIHLLKSIRLNGKLIEQY